MAKEQWDPKAKTFLITGGASGMGAGYAHTFLELGAKSVAILDISEQNGNAFVESLNKLHGNKAVFIKCDVSKEDDITRAFDAVLAQFKQIDVIINNAGLNFDTEEKWRVSCDVNWQGLVSITLKGVKHMRKDEGGAGGTIANVSSTAALVKFPFQPIYCGSKMAILHFSQCLAMDPFFENTGIRVLTICFGITKTPFIKNLAFNAYDPKLTTKFAAALEDKSLIYQNVESAVTAFVEMFKNGAPGTIWLSMANKPVKNITPVVDSAFKEFEKTFE